MRNYFIATACLVATACNTFGEIPEYAGSNDAANNVEPVLDAGADSAMPDTDMASVDADASPSTVDWTTDARWRKYPPPLPDITDAFTVCEPSDATLASVDQAKRYRVASSVVDEVPILAAATTTSIGATTETMVVQLRFLTPQKELAVVAPDENVFESLFEDVTDGDQAFDVIARGNQVLFMATTPGPNAHYARCVLGDPVVCRRGSISLELQGNAADGLRLFVTNDGAWGVLRYDSSPRFGAFTLTEEEGVVADEIESFGPALGGAEPIVDFEVNIDLSDVLRTTYVRRDELYRVSSLQGGFVTLERESSPVAASAPYRFQFLDNSNGLASFFDDGGNHARAFGSFDGDATLDAAITSGLADFDLCVQGRDDPSIYGFAFDVYEDDRQDTYVVFSRTDIELLVEGGIEISETEIPGVSEVRAACDEMGAWAVYRAADELHIRRYVSSCAQ